MARSGDSLVFPCDVLSIAACLFFITRDICVYGWVLNGSLLAMQNAVFLTTYPWADVNFLGPSFATWSLVILRKNFFRSDMRSLPPPPQ